MTTAIYAVAGLKCEYGMANVLENVRSLSGVTDVAMDLIKGGQSPLMVRSRTKLVTEAVRSAVENAGFGLLAPRGSEVGGRGDSSPPWTAIPGQTYLHSSGREEHRNEKSR
jgi:copper chaperone